MNRGILLTMFIGTYAWADLPTIGYVSEFFENTCHNPYLVVPGAGGTELTSHGYLLEIIDNMNRDNIGLKTGLPAPTTYATDIATQSIVSTGYVNDSLNFLAESMECCLGGEINPDTRKCESCDVWSMGANSKCPSDYIKQPLENVVVIPDNTSCPAGSEVYYHIPDHCMGAQYVYTDGSNDYDNNISICTRGGIGSWGSKQLVLDDNVYGLGVGCSSAIGTCQKWHLLGQAYGSTIGALNDETFSSPGTSVCWCRITHIGSPDGSFLAPFNGKWAACSPNYSGTCQATCAMYTQSNSVFNRAMMIGRLYEE